MRLGIIGGAGMLGRTIAKAALDRSVVAPSELWISSRSGRAPDGAFPPEVRVTHSNRELCEACDTVVLSVPPAAASGLSLGAPDALVISVMAGVTVERLARIAGSGRVVRAMSSPAAEFGLAFSPWIAGAGVTERDREGVRAIFSACGLHDEVGDEALIDVFTALTGPVPGFVAYFAAAMADFAVAEGAPEPMADRALRQLFLASGRMLSEGAAAPRDHVRRMIDYAGTTAAGLGALDEQAVAARIARGLRASVQRAREIG